MIEFNMAAQCEWCDRFTTGRARGFGVSGPVVACLKCLAAGKIAPLELDDELTAEVVYDFSSPAPAFGPDECHDYARGLAFAYGKTVPAGNYSEAFYRGATAGSGGVC